MSELKFKFKKKGDNIVAFDTEDNTKSYGKINIKTGQCTGGTLCFQALREHLATLVVKKTYKVWLVIEECTEFADGTEVYKDLKDEETASVGSFGKLDNAIDRMNIVANTFNY
jgi:hypothetical protein